jgi:hypothetical protein
VPAHDALAAPAHHVSGIRRRAVAAAPAAQEVDAGAPDERVVARSAGQDVATRAAVEAVVVPAARQAVGSGAASQTVVALPAGQPVVAGGASEAISFRASDEVGGGCGNGRRGRQREGGQAGREETQAPVVCENGH